LRRPGRTGWGGLVSLLSGGSAISPCNSAEADLHRRLVEFGIVLAQNCPQIYGCPCITEKIGRPDAHDDFTPLIPEPEAAAQKWAERHGGIPINHMLVMRTELSRSRPDAVRDVFRQFLDSKRAAGLPEGGTLDPYRFGVEACRPILQVIIDFCHQQKLISRPMSVDELFDDTTRALGTS
jgi:hypothetical protein